MRSIWVPVDSDNAYENTSQLKQAARQNYCFSMVCLGETLPALHSVASKSLQVKISSTIPEVANQVQFPWRRNYSTLLRWPNAFLSSRGLGPWYVETR